MYLSIHESPFKLIKEKKKTQPGKTLCTAAEIITETWPPSSMEAVRPLLSWISRTKQLPLYGWASTTPAAWTSGSGLMIILLGTEQKKTVTCVMPWRLKGAITGIRSLFMINIMHCKKKSLLIIRQVKVWRCVWSCYSKNIYSFFLFPFLFLANYFLHFIVDLLCNNICCIFMC